MTDAIKNRFNLVDEKWIPVANHGLASLTDIFSQESYSALGGNPVQKIALTKLMLAIAQSAYTPVDEADWQKIGAKGLAKKALLYLNKSKDCFWLYGKQPFLQMPAIAAASKQPFGAVSPEIATGNTTILIQSQIEHELSDAEKALLLIALVNFALGGKKTDNSVVLSKGYAGKTNEKGKPSTGKPGPALGFMGFLHNFVTGSTLTETIWLNLLSKDQIAAIPYIDKANCLGTAPWEKMPEGEYCSRAKELITTYLGRLVPISRFVLLAEDGLHYSEGINYPGYANGGYDISTSVEYAGKKPRALWVDTEKRPWRQLTAILSFLANEQKNTFDCQQVRFAIPKAKRAASKIGLWSGGLCVSSNAGEQYASGSDDFVESEISFDSSWLGEEWFLRLKAEMAIIDELSRNVYGCTMGYYKHQLADGKNQAAQASNLFWQHAEHHFQALLDACGNSTSESIRPIFVKAALKAYDEYCPKETARQLDAWAANRPQLGKLLSSANTQTGSVS